MMLLQHLTCVTPILDCLLSAGAITEQECNAVKQKPQTLRARTLIDTVLAKGNTAATSFRNSLQERDPVLYKDLFAQQDTRSLPTDDIAALPMEEQLRKLQEERTCKVCMDREVSIVFIPCGHLVVCKDCAPSLRKCPICRGTIKGTVRTFLSWTDGPRLLAWRGRGRPEEQKFQVILSLDCMRHCLKGNKERNVKIKKKGQKKSLCLNTEQMD